MPSKTRAALLLAMGLGIGAGAWAQAQGSGFSAFMQPAPVESDQDLQLSGEEVTEEETPAWLRDSERLEKMLGADGAMRVENPRVVKRLDTPIAGLEGYVVRSTLYTKGTPAGEDSLTVFYSDKSGRYVMVGMLIDTQKGVDMNQLAERYVRGELSDTPANALQPAGMHAVVMKGDEKSKSEPLYFVIDLGPTAGRENMIVLARLHQKLMVAGKHPREVRVIPISAGNSEYDTGAMAIALGAEATGGSGLERLLQYAAAGKKTSWMQPRVLNDSPELKQLIGVGVFRIQDNSTQALLARLNTLPLVYVGKGSGAQPVVLPADEQGWEKLLLE